MKASIYFYFFRKRPEYYTCTAILDIVQSKWKSLALRKKFTKHVLQHANKSKHEVEVSIW